MRALIIGLALASQAALAQSTPAPNAVASQARQIDASKTKDQEGLLQATTVAKQPAADTVPPRKPEAKVATAWWLSVVDAIGIWLKKLVEDPVALFTFVLAFFTIRLWRSTEKLWVEAKSAGMIAERSANAAKTAADAAKESAKAYVVSERAWLSLTQVDTAKFVDATFLDETGKEGKKGDGYMFTMRWTNQGKTPAVNVMILAKGECVLASSDIPEFAPKSETAQGQAPVFPNTTVSSQSYPFNDQQIADLKIRKCRIFLYGRTTYSDIFDTENTTRHTQICMEVRYAGMTEGRVQFSFGTVGAQNSVL